MRDLLRSGATYVLSAGTTDVQVALADTAVLVGAYANALDADGKNYRRSLTIR